MYSQKAKKSLKKILGYITRSWEPDSNNIHSRLRLLPPFLVEVFAYLFAIGIIYQAGKYLLSLFL